jgi:hypothetical protein
MRRPKEAIEILTIRLIQTKSFSKNKRQSTFGRDKTVATQRKFPRMPLKVYLKLFDQKTGELIGYLVDVNSQGLLVTSEASIETNVMFRLRLELPTEIEGSLSFLFSATTIWSEKDRETTFYNTGFRLENVTDKDKKIIEGVIEKFCFR